MPLFAEAGGSGEGERERGGKGGRASGKRSWICRSLRTRDYRKTAELRQSFTFWREEKIPPLGVGGGGGTQNEW